MPFYIKRRSISPTSSLVLSFLLLLCFASPVLAVGLSIRINDIPGPGLTSVLRQVAGPIAPDQDVGTEVSSDSLDSIGADIRSPFGAAIRSALIPGWGQWYNNQRVKGMIMGVAQIVLIAAAVYQNQWVVTAASENKRTAYKARRDGIVWLFMAERGYSILDAYVDAHFVGFDQDIGLELPEPAAEDSPPLPEQ